MRYLTSKASLFLVLLVMLLLQYSLGPQRRSQSQIGQNRAQKISKSLKVSTDYRKIPLYFTPNEGQFDEKAIFFAKTSRYTLWLTKGGLVFDSTRRLKKNDSKSLVANSGNVNNPESGTYVRDVSRLIFLNSNKSPEVIPLDYTEHKVNYFIGNDKSKWRTNIETSKAVLYKDLYRNINLKVYGCENQIKYDWIIKKGGNPDDICFKYKNVKRIVIDKDDNLVIEMEFGELIHKKPLSYQIINGKKVEVNTNLEIDKNNVVRLKVGDYRKNRELVIDPLLIYSTHLGGSDGQCAAGVVVDKNGNAYVCGGTYSSDFPTTSGAYDTTLDEMGDVFITKLNSAGTSLLYSTYLGGNSREMGFGIAVDNNGNAYVTGQTASSDFPTTSGTFDASVDGEDAFITKLNATGASLLYSTYLGGTANEAGIGIAIDKNDTIYVCGGTDSSDFPTTTGAFDVSYNGSVDIFITKLNATGTSLLYSTYLGGSATDCYVGYEVVALAIAVDKNGNVYICSGTNSSDFPITSGAYNTNYNGGYSDVFITKLNSTGTSLLYSTFLGGSSGEMGFGIAVDKNGNAYVTGQTASNDFPINPGDYDTNLDGGSDAFISKINSNGKTLLYSSYLGGTNWDIGLGITVDGSGNTYVIGQTGSRDFPITSDAFDSSYNGGISDVFIINLNATGTKLLYSTFLGGSGWDSTESSDMPIGAIAADESGNVYVTGATYSDDFPTTSGAYDTSFNGDIDVFITKFNFSEVVRIVSWNILNYSGSNEEFREEHFRIVMESLSPDILVVQEMASFTGVDQFLEDVLKPISKNYRAAKFFDGPDTDNALFYDKSKFKLQSRKQIPTSFRDIAEYTIKIKKGPGKGSKLNIYSVHFTEGLGVGDKMQREGEANTLRTYLNGLPLNSLYLVCGTFNMTESNEKAYKLLTDAQIDNIGRLKDPLDKPGKWHHKKKFKSLHTESTRKTKYGDGVGGGLNDRYDMILISYSLDQNGKLTYRPDSCAVCGNDGKHFKKDINKPKNGIVSPEIADALYKASDHLPVIIELVPPENSK